MKIALALAALLVGGAAFPAAMRPERPGKMRVVSLVPSLTDLVLALGEGGRLVGVSRFDDDPRVAGLPRVGGYLDPNLEAVVRLRPDLVLAYDGAAEAASLGALRRAGLRLLAIRADSLPEIEQSAALVAGALGNPEAGERLRESMDAALRAARMAAAGRPPIRVAVVVGWQPLVVAGRGSYLEPLLEAAGGENVVGSRLAWPTYSVEALVAQAPAVVVDGAPGEAATAAQWTGLLRAHGVRLVQLPNGDLFLPGPRALRALPALVSVLGDR